MRAARTPLGSSRSANPCARARAMPGSSRSAIKDPESITHGPLVKEYYKTTLHDSAITKEFIDSGRGLEKPTEIRGKTDDLSRRYNAVGDRVRALRSEYDEPAIGRS
jgi:hypothetical protein